jgi:hypothetical protein
VQDDIVLLVVGFVLTTVVGGLLGHYFQGRAWRHQNEARLRESERAAATRVCTELSVLMDKRLYRMRQLDETLGDPRSTRDELEPHLDRYRDVRYEWNDSLNRNLAGTWTYFGRDVREYLEEHIYKGFRRLHGQLLARLSGQCEGKEHPQASLEPELKQLSDHIYAVTVMMTDLIREDRVGRNNPDFGPLSPRRRPRMLSGARDT